MKSFKGFLKEGKQGNRPSVETSVSTNAPRRKRSVSSSRVISTPEGSIITNIPTGSGKTPEEQISRAETGRNNPRGTRATDSQVTDYLGKQRDTGGKTSFDMDATAQRATVRPTAGTEPRKPLKPGSYVVAEPEPTKPTKPTTATVKQSEVSKNIKASLRQKGFGNVTGVDAQGYATYVPPKDVPKGETGRRAQRTSNPRSYSSVKAEIEAAKGFSGVKSGGLETRNVPAPVERFRKNRAVRRGVPDPFTSTASFNQSQFERGLKTASQRTAAVSGSPQQLGLLTDKGKPTKSFTRTPVTPRSTAPDPFASVATKTKRAVGGPSIKADPDQLTLDIAKATPSKPTSGTTGAKPRVRGGDLARPVGAVPDAMMRGAYDQSLKGQSQVKGGKTTTTPPVQNVKVSEVKPSSLKSGGPRVTSSNNVQQWAQSQPTGTKPSGKPVEVKIQKPLPPKKSQVVKNVERSLSGVKQAYPKDSSAARRLVKLRQGGRAFGRLAGPAFAAWDAYDVYKSERERGQTKERATKAAITKAGGGALGAWAGAKAGAALGGAIGSIVPGAGTAIGAGLGGLAGGVLGYMGGEKIGSAVLGASQKDKDWMKWANRKNQAGTTAADATFKSGNKAVIKDKEGKERVGYLAYKDGKEVYKHANDPKSLQYTSSNPLERLGRTFLPGMYKGKDEEERKRRVAALKASTSK